VSDTNFNFKTARPDLGLRGLERA